MNSRKTTIALSITVVILAALVVYLLVSEPPAPKISRAENPPAPSPVVAAPAAEPAPAQAASGHEMPDPAPTLPPPADNKPTVVVSGLVTDPKGVPVPDAHISEKLKGGDGDFEETGDILATTDHQGRFSFSIKPEAAVLVASHPDYKPGYANFVPRRGAQEKITFVLQSVGAIEGIVTMGGEPAAGWQVKLLAGLNDGIKTTTGPDGTFKLELVTPGPVVIGVRKTANAEDTWFTQEAVVEPKSVTTVYFDIRSDDSVIEGCVLAGGRAPEQDVMVTLTLRSTNGEITKTARLDNGWYRFDGLPPGTCELKARMDGGRRMQNATVQLGSSQLVRQDFQFQETATVKGEIAGNCVGAALYFGELRQFSLKDRDRDNVYLDLRDKSFSVEVEPGTYTFVAAYLSESQEIQTVVKVIEARAGEIVECSIAPPGPGDNASVLMPE